MKSIIEIMFFKDYNIRYLCGKSEKHFEIITEQFSIVCIIF